ncbi:hypothetical protein LOK49_LG03G02072 [Camellia lanceoleosa]|uniref:Uncharacterized protein n=1 Tax=Camellia lanceoleosa TaxID=1840588 RepID=A0ACC0IH32_9ERIC|nr:hypothetical protein LOK49_LG03G02072 [Camellia lanceoleosa]
MKIFNWVHRKFHHKDGFGGNVKKSPETECQVVLENVTLVELMKRMMKRKIHPDLEEKFEKMDSQMKPTTCGLIAHGYGTNESVSLLQTKESIV